ncbi:mind kinetochore complex component [Botrytis cinerea]
MVSRLRQFALDEFEMILQERRVVERLNGLEGVIESARRRKARGVDAETEGRDVGVAPHTLPAPSPRPPSWPPISPLYTTQQSQLNAKLQTTQSQNASLADEIQKQREEIEKLVRGVEIVVEDLDRANEVMDREVDGLGKEALEAENVLRDT